MTFAADVHHLQGESAPCRSKFESAEVSGHLGGPICAALAQPLADTTNKCGLVCSSCVPNTMVCAAGPTRKPRAAVPRCACRRVSRLHDACLCCMLGCKLHGAGQHECRALESKKGAPLQGLKRRRTRNTGELTLLAGQNPLSVGAFECVDKVPDLLTASRRLGVCGARADVSPLSQKVDTGMTTRVLVHASSCARHATLTARKASFNSTLGSPVHIFIAGQRNAPSESASESVLQALAGVAVLPSAPRAQFWTRSTGCDYSMTQDARGAGGVHPRSL